MKKQRWEESEKRKKEEKRSKKRKSQNGAHKGRKVAKHCVFPAKAAGAEPSGQMRDEKLHAIAAQNTLPSQNAQSASLSEHFWKLGCSKSARHCGAKQISKSKCTKHNFRSTF